MVPPLPSPVPVDVLDNGLDYWTFAIAVAALVVTAVTGFLIFLQIRQTRLSIEMTKSSLDLAEKEQRISRAIIVADQKARMDEAMPLITVTVIREYGPAQVWDGDPASPNSTATRTEPGAREWVMPRDSGVWFETECTIRIANDGPRRARVEWRPTADVRVPAARVIDLEPGGASTVDVHRHTPLGTWIGIANLYNHEPAVDVAGNPLDERATTAELGVVYYRFPGDSGAAEHHRVVQGGTIVRRVPGNDAGWTTKPDSDYPQIVATVEPFTRSYWSSMKDGIPLLSEE